LHVLELQDIPLIMSHLTAYLDTLILKFSFGSVIFRVCGLDVEVAWGRRDSSM